MEIKLKLHVSQTHVLEFIEVGNKMSRICRYRRT